MRILVLGGNGYVGAHIVEKLQKQKANKVIIGSRNLSERENVLKIDSTSRNDLDQNLLDFDVVINCVTGTGETIINGAQELVGSALTSNYPHIVHLSTQSVYGSKEGIVSESTKLKDDLGWYGHAKIEAEKSMQGYAQAGGAVTIFRIGCVLGADSPLWHTRFENWLSSGWLGDLGEYGDGWSNLIDIDDIATAVSLACTKRPDKLQLYNLSAPDAPRWNQYFIDLGTNLGKTPVKRKNYSILKLKVYLLGVPQKVLEHLLKKLHIKVNFCPMRCHPHCLCFLNKTLN